MAARPALHAGPAWRAGSTDGSAGLSGEDRLLLLRGEEGGDRRVRRHGRVVIREQFIERGDTSRHHEGLDLLASLEHDPVINTYPREPGPASGDVGLDLDP